MCKPRLLLAVAILGGLMSPVESAVTKKPDNAACDTQWEELSSQYTHESPADYKGLLSAWKALDMQCTGTERYKARLALTYYFLDRPKNAKAALASIGNSSVHEPLVELVQILVDTSLLHDEGKLNEEQLRQLEQRLHTFALNNPTDIVGMSLLADTFSELGRHDVAIELYVKALNAIGPTPRAAGLMRNLTITYAAAHRYEDAYDAAGKALALDKDLLSDLYFVCAVARSQASIGKIKGAKDSLTLLSVKKPEVVENPEFKSAVAFVKAKAAGQ